MGLLLPDIFQVILTVAQMAYLWQERCCNGNDHRLSMISVKQMIVQSTAPPILLHCDVIGNIQHTPIRISHCQCRLQSALLPTIFFSNNVLLGHYWWLRCNIWSVTFIGVTWGHQQVCAYNSRLKRARDMGVVSLSLSCNDASKDMQHDLRGSTCDLAWPRHDVKCCPNHVDQSHHIFVSTLLGEWNTMAPELCC